MKILNYGSLNIDYVYQVDHMVRPGETISSADMSVFCGGKGLNQSIALARAGIDVIHAGKIGNDSEGQLLLEECKRNNIDISCIELGDEKSGHTIIQVDKNGQNSILLFGGSNQKQGKNKIHEIIHQFSKGDFLILQNEINNLDYIIEVANEKGMQIILNPSPFNDNILNCDLSKVTYFIVNEIEASQMTGKNDIDEILTEILRKYPESKIILTLGEKGSIYHDKYEHYFQEAFTTEAVDTTAAGDTFTGYFFAGMIQSGEVRQSLKIAAKAASIAVSRTGAAPSIPSLEEVMHSLQEQ